MSMEKIGFLKNTIQEYAWGSNSAIADLLGLKNPENKPQAELWMGAHWKAPSLVQHNGQWVPLTDLIRKNPKAILGDKVAQDFNDQLPYLFKVLAAAKPLSIQAHPDLQQAREGFHSENAQKIPQDAAERNYLDDNHKPECICALSRFWALSRFRKIPGILHYLNKLNLRQLRDECTEFGRQPTSRGLKRFYTTLMSLDPDRQKEVVDGALRSARRYTNSDPVFKWILKLATDYPNDIGAISPIFLNLICLEPGQAIYLDAGELHAYLQGLGIELMANSDNVLLEPRTLTPNEFVYPCPAKEFVLSVIKLKPGALYQSPVSRSIEILICTEGTLIIADLGNQIETQLQKGASAVIPATVKHYAIRGQGICYKAAVPV
jgi:mannose-6-phosphate isomerase